MKSLGVVSITVMGKDGLHMRNIIHHVKEKPQDEWNNNSAFLSIILGGFPSLELLASLFIHS